jgi:hypothetical protein
MPEGYTAKETSQTTTSKLNQHQSKIGKHSFQESEERITKEPLRMLMMRLDVHC